MNAELFNMMGDFLEKIKNTSVPVDTIGGVIKFSPFYALFHVSSVRNRYYTVINGLTCIEDMPNRHTTKGRVEVKMGDYKKGSSFHAVFPLPYVFNRDTAEIMFRRASNICVWSSIEDYLDRLDDGLGTNSAGSSFLTFSEESPSRYFETHSIPKLKLEELKYDLETVTRSLRRGDIVNSKADFIISDSKRYVANSEGTRVYTTDQIWSLLLNVRVIDSENRVLEHDHSFKGRGGQPLPSLEQLKEEGEKLAEEIIDIKNAKIEKNGTYPTIMDYNNHGVIWHEVVGHSLEGHRLQDGEWGDAANLFADKIGERGDPRFISLYDDPTRTDLNAHYLYDDEGMPGQRVVLIENGVPLNFLHSRESAGFMGTQSNGHARAEDSEIPVSRMSNLIVKSSREVSYDELKDMLIRECRKQHKQYGLIMSECNGGLTLPSDSMFNTFPTNVFRIYQDGRTERVRGIYIVGTPVQTLDNMMATSDRYSTFDGFCGAESGSISSTITAPDLLLRKVEVNRIPNSQYNLERNPVLPD